MNLCYRNALKCVLLYTVCNCHAQPLQKMEAVQAFTTILLNYHRLVPIPLMIRQSKSIGHIVWWPLLRPPALQPSQLVTSLQLIWRLCLSTGTRSSTEFHGLNLKIGHQDSRNDNNDSVLVWWIHHTIPPSCQVSLVKNVKFNLLRNQCFE